MIYILYIFGSISLGVFIGYLFRGQIDQRRIEYIMRKDLANEAHEHIIKWRMVDSYNMKAHYVNDPMNDYAVFIHFFYNHAGSRKWEATCISKDFTNREWVMGTSLSPKIHKFMSGNGNIDYWEKDIKDTNYNNSI